MNTQYITLAGKTIPLTVDDRGTGRAYLLLHGGAGTASMRRLANALAVNERAVLPTHPGFDGQPRPESFHTVAQIAETYLALIEELDLEDVVIIGNSMGGWIALEMALRASPRVSAIVVMNTVGIEPTAATAITNPAKLAPEERGAYSFHDPARFGFKLTDQDAVNALLANQQTLAVFANDPYMHDPDLQKRLPDVSVPTLILWGESDRITTLDYGRLFAEAMPAATFRTIPKAGHFPQIEQLEEVLEAIKAFAG